MSEWRSLGQKSGSLTSSFALDRQGVNANGREGFLPLEGTHINPVQLFFRNTQTTGIGTKYDAITTAGSSADTSVTNTTAGGTEIQATKTAGGSVLEFISGRTPVGGATFTSAVIYFWAKASVDTVNAGIRFRVYKRTNAGVETELTGSPFDSGVKLSTFNNLYEVTCNFADTALAEDDRLVFKPYLINIDTMGVGTVTLSFNGSISAITPVAFDAVSNAAGHGGANPSSPITFSHTCSGSNRYLEVDITVGTPTAPDSDIAITGVTYNGDSLTQVPSSLVHSAGGSRGYCVKYYLVAPATGTNTVSISFTNSSPEALDAIACAAKSFNNVNQTTPFSNLVSATGTSSAPGVTATSQLGSIVSDVLVDGSAITTSGKTLRWNNDVNPNSAGGNGAGATADGASTVRMSYSGSTDDWAIVAYSINPVNGDDSYVNVYPAVTFKAESGGVTLTLSDSSHGHTADVVVLSTSSLLAVQDALHGHVADNIVLTAQSSLAVDEALHAHTTDNLTLTSETALVIAEATSAHLADSPTLSVESVLAIAEALHGHLADNIGLSSETALAIAEALHAHAADNLTLGTASGVDLVIAESLHAQAADNLALTLQSLLAVQDALHSHAADNVDLSTQLSLAIAEALHGHLADNLTLSVTTDISLVIAEALHAHTADNLALTSETALVIAEAASAHLADSPALSVASVLAVAEALHALTSDNLALNTGAALLVNESLHAQLADNITLSIAETLAIIDALHSHAADNVGLTFVEILYVFGQRGASAVESARAVAQNMASRINQQASTRSGSRSTSRRR